MSGWAYCICRFPDEATAIAVASQLGTAVLAGTRDAGNENFSFHVFDQWDRWPGTNAKGDAGQATAGFWVNTAFNTDTPAGLQAYEDVQTSGYVQANPPNPSNVWA